MLPALGAVVLLSAAVTCQVVIRRDGSNLGSVPTDIPRSTVQVYLNDNSIETITRQDFADMTTLTTLSLRNNFISEIEAGAFSDLSSVTELQLDGNSLSALYQNMFQGLSSLEKLLLGNNMISEIDVGAFQGLVALKELELQKNELTRLRADMFKGMPELEVLELTNNSIATIDRYAFSGLSNLKTLYLYGCALTELRSNMFSGLNSLEELVLTRNRINAIEDGTFVGLGNLKKLWLDWNEITELRYNMFLGLTSLERLAVHHNRLTTITGGIFTGLFTLKILDLDDNDLREIRADSFRGMNSLAEVCLYNNQLTSLEFSVFTGLPRPLSLSLGENPLDCNQQLCWLKTSQITWLPFGDRKLEPDCASGVPWNSLNLNCPQEVVCPDPGEVQSALKSGQGPYTVNTQVTYTCVGGSQAGSGGGGTITCQSNGQWTQKPSCTVLDLCPDPGEVPSAYRSGQGPYTLNSQVTYTCVGECQAGSGGGGTITCQSNGQWTQKPSCTGVLCTMPIASNARRLSDGPWSCGELVGFECRAGYRLIGPGIVMQCKPDGLWYQLLPGYCRLEQTTPKPKVVKCEEPEDTTRWLVISITAGIGGVLHAVIITATCMWCRYKCKRSKK